MGSIDGTGFTEGGKGMSSGWSIGDYWYREDVWGNDFDLLFHGWAAGTSFDPTPNGIGHAVSAVNGAHYCVGKTEWSSKLEEPLNPHTTITYSDFSKLGACDGAKGPTGTLSYCKTSGYYKGTLPPDCPVAAVHVEGSVGTRALDHDLQLGGGGDHEAGPEGIIMLFNTPEEGASGFIRAQLDGEGVVFCVTSWTDFSEPDLTRYELEVVELGVCPGAPVSGSVTSCLY